MCCVISIHTNLHLIIKTFSKHCAKILLRDEVKTVNIIDENVKTFTDYSNAECSELNKRETFAPKLNKLK